MKAGFFKGHWPVMPKRAYLNHARLLGRKDHDEWQPQRYAAFAPIHPLPSQF